AISQDGEFIAVIREVDKTAVLYHLTNPDTSTTLDDVDKVIGIIDNKEMISQEKFDGKFDLTISSNLPYDDLESDPQLTRFIILSQDNEEPIVLCKDGKHLKKLSPYCLKDLKNLNGRA